MKLYIGDYLGDTHHLGALEHGAYLLLLMAMWRAGGTLPAIDANLAKLARCTPDEWATIRDVVLAYFKRSRGRLTHKRIAQEIAKYEDVSGKRSEAGKQGGDKKSKKNKGPALAIASDLPPSPEAIADITRTKTRTIDSSEDKSSADEVVLSGDVDRDAWVCAKALLRDQGRLTDAEAGKFFGKLLSTNNLQARQIFPAIASAMEIQTLDPKAYLTKAAARLATRRPGAPEKRVAFV